ncbi:MAG: YqgE/AlgH family protein [Gammaproteobacteria bacterium]|nr:YqgE/AlgH family protein [Gammaproteobacteria bacterium]
MSDTTHMTGHLLIAMPTMMDPNFHQTVTYICEHSDLGALGLVINRPLDMGLGEVLEQLSLDSPDETLTAQPVLRGGPVQTERGFVLHESTREWEATMPVGEAIYVTTSQDILSSLAAGNGPERALIVLGYAGWGAGQLDAEIRENAWLSVPADPRIVFETPFERRWEEAARKLGVNLTTLNTQAGHA